jgi:RNA polymerase sigma-32 factor
MSHALSFDLTPTPLPLWDSVDPVNAESSAAPSSSYELTTNHLLNPAENLDAYIQAVQRIPILTLAEEQDCATRLQQEQDLTAAHRLIMSHLRLVVSIARQYAGYGLQQADLIQEGNVGLMKAVKRFDPTRGVRLVSFAMHWIKAEIHEFVLKNWRIVKIASTKAQRKLFFNLRSMRQGLESLNPHQVQDIATKLNVKPEDVIEMEMRLNGHDTSIDPLIIDSDDERQAPMDYLTDYYNEPTHQLELATAEQLHTVKLQAALDTLDARSRHIIESRWLHDDEQHGATLHDLAAEYGVSAERIRQIEQKAMKKMKELLVTG